MRVRLISDAEVSLLTWPIVRRGSALRVTTSSLGVYLVTGGSEPHWVNLIDPACERCDCADHLARARVCKHIVAAMIAMGDPRILAFLARGEDDDDGSS